MIAAFKSEFLLLNRRRMWLTSGMITVAFAIVATTLQILTMQNDADGALPGSGEGMPSQLLVGPGGATAAVSWATFGFGFLLILTLFTSRIGNEFSRGTFRTALLHNPNRWSVIGGKMGALLAVTVALVIVGLGAGALTAAFSAPSQGIDTTGWFGADALRDTSTDIVGVLGWSLGWALIATALAVFIRSVPIALGVGVTWFGPVENVVGEGQEFAQRWFPGLLLQRVVVPDVGQAVSVAAATATLAVYGVVLVTALALFFGRLDVTG